MGDFTFTSPEGRNYTVSGPPGATADQAWGILQGNIEQPAEASTQPGFFERMGTALQGGMATDLHNQRAAASQGTTPIISAHMPNLVSDRVEVGDDNNIYFKDASGKLQPTDTNKHVVLRDPEDRQLKVFQRTEDTDESALPSLGRLLSPGMGAGNIEISRAAPAIAGAASRLGVDVPLGIASQSPLTRLTGQVVSRAPGGGPMHEAVETGIGQLGAKMAETAAGATPAEAGGAVRSGFADYFKPRAKQAVSDAYDRVDDLVHPTATAGLDRTRDVVAEILAKKQAYGDEALGQAVEMVAPALQRPGGLTYQAIKDLRTTIGEKVDTGFLPADTSGAELKRIYGGLSEDLGNAVKTLGGPRASTAFETANAMARAKAQYLEKLDKVVGPKTRSDEGIFGTLQRMAGKGDSADIQTLDLARRAVPAEAWKSVAHSVISRLGRDGEGKFSPSLFVRDYGDLSQQGRRILFHSVGGGKLVPFLNDIAEVSSAYKQAGKLGNPSGSAGHGGMLAAFGAAAASLMHGDLHTPMAILGSALGINAVARGLAAPATAASMSRWTRAYDAVLRRPGPQAIAAFNLTSRGLGRAMAEQAGDPDRADELTQRLHETVRQPGMQ